MTANATPAPPLPEAVPVSGEKKHITVLFADVAGSMDLQERLDAEVWAQIMGRFVSILAEGVRKYGGTVDKFTGDGIMALFGAPVAQEDHARRACHAAWHLTKAIGEYSAELRREQDLELHVRLGLSSGEVVVGRVGDDVTLDPTALGHTVGLAQRMEAMAEPGTAYLSEYTARLVEGWFHLEELGWQSVKGAAHLLRIYVLGRPQAALVRSTVGTAPLVGRQRELSILEEALALAHDGHAQVVGVVGEAGVGKSRLCEEFARSVMARGITVLRTAGVSHGREAPLLPMLAFQREYFGIAEVDDPSAARQKVTERLLDLDPELEPALPLMFDFLEIPEPDRPMPSMAPELRMRRVFNIVRRINARRSQRETLVLVFEDLHWFDSQSKAFLERLIESYPGSRTLVLTNFRPEFSAGWMRHSYYRQVPLGPLGAEAVRELLSGLLGCDTSLLPLVDILATRTGGNPFFVEEMIRDLVEKAILKGAPGSYRLSQALETVDVPPSVQAVLAARIDRLSVAPRELLQTGAVIGRAFPRSLIACVSQLSDADLDTSLRELCGAGLLYEATSEPFVQYEFWHPLTQEVAYRSLLGPRRRRLHAMVASTMAASQAEAHDERAAVVALHYDRAGDHREAAIWEDRAATWISGRDSREAMRRWQAALAHVDAVPQDRQAQRVGVGIRSQLLRVGTRAGMTEEQTDTLFDQAKALAEQLGDDSLLTRLFQARGTERVMRGHMPAGVNAYLEAHRLSGRVGDRGIRAAVCTGLGAALAFVGPLDQAQRFTEEVQGVSRGDPDEGVQYLGFSPLVRSFLSRAEILAYSGFLAEALRQAEATVELARERREGENLAWTLSLFPILADLIGWDQGASIAKAEEALRIGEESGNLFVRVLALRARAFAALVKSEPSEALAFASEALAESSARRLTIFEQGRLLVCLARSRLALGDQAGALSAADEAVQATQVAGVQVFECAALLARAGVQRAAGSGASEAGSDLKAALQLVNTTGARTYLPFIREELGRLHNDEAELWEALKRYRQVGATGHARRLEGELSARTAR